MPRSKMEPLNNMSTKTNNWQLCYSIFFVCLVLGSFVLIMFKSLGGGIAGFETNFFGRGFLISTFNRMRYSMGDQVFPQVLIGKEGWMEYSADGNLDDYQNAYIFPEQLEGIHQKLDGLTGALDARNITLIVVIVPNKVTIYPDKVSEKLEKVNEQSRLDVFLDLMKQTNSTRVIDLRPSLRQARQEYQLYYKTDTHWNALGAYIAYREIMNTASQIHPDLQPHMLDEFIVQETNFYTMELPRITGMDFILERRIELQPKFNSLSVFQRFPPLSSVSMSWGNDSQEKTLLMYHDSFGVALHQFLQYHFKQAMYILNSPDTQLSNTYWIDVINPDVVIIEVVERNLPYLDTLLSNQ